MAAKQHSPARTFTTDQKIALVTEIERRHRAGEGTLRALAAAVGITDTYYYNWLKKGIRPLPMRPVEVTALVPAAPTALVVAEREPDPAPAANTVVAVEPPAAPLVLVAPGGYRLEGLAVETAAQLLKALAC